MTTQTLTITEFLRARIAERVLAAEKWRAEGAEVVFDEYGDVFVMESEPWVRVLAECEAHRRIVAYYVACERLKAEGHATDYAQGEMDAYHSALRALASVYADHPDFLEEWRA